ncbi:transporter substrate-binding domain-containing protein [Clostridium sp. BJN0001]|uniref:transporter substrate-binding domain-containing protein n=1 Tax=Clostridium sp. BJN0001 TaxID=2930219 RepID=UPI001FD2780E|nr:transporter substrate-binding domain-containing protein [Clostridium sp. BJN0001]
MKKKIITSLVVAVLSVLTLAGCGKTQTATTTQGTEKTLKVGTDATFQPFEYMENNEYKGFDIELVTELSKEMGYENVEFVNTDFKGLIPGLIANKFDLISSAMYITDERKESINFSDPYYPGGLSIMVKTENNDVKNLDDLKGKNVAVQVGTKSVEYLEKNCSDIKRVEVETNNEMFLQLESGKVDAVVTGRPAALVYAKASGKVKVLDYEVTKEMYGYGLRKDDEDMLKKVNKALEALKENGKYDEISEKYFGK